MAFSPLLLLFHPPGRSSRHLRSPPQPLTRGVPASTLCRQEGSDDGLLPKAGVVVLAIVNEALPGGLVSERDEERLCVGSLQSHRGFGPPLGEQACHCPFASALEERVALCDLLRKMRPPLQRFRPPTAICFG